MTYSVKLLSLLLLVTLDWCSGSERSFEVDYERNTFLKDGLPFSYISGCVHYFRIPKVYWRDRLLKVKASGLDTIETYIPWNFHSVQGASYDFSGQRDIVEFLNIVDELGLLAIVRGFPYSDTEWDMGGFPYWLLSSKYNPHSNPISLRSSDSRFMSNVDDWLQVILPKLEPLLYNNNGPIIMLQVENEYGSYYTRDTAYTKMLSNRINTLLKGKVVLFTTDGGIEDDLKYGHIEGVLQTVDFGPGSDPNSTFHLLRKHQPKGPIVNSEYYTGWLDHWGESSHHRTSSEAICSTFEKMLLLNASVNFYMFAGGTNFGYWSCDAVTTSYDYDSPISENGDTTEKYFKIKEVIAKYKPQPLIPVPANVTRMNYGRVPLTYRGSIWDNLKILSPAVVNSAYPMTYEDLSVLGGYVLYRTTIPALPSPTKLHMYLSFDNPVHDFAHIFVDKFLIGTLDRGGIKRIAIDAKAGDELDILIESKGRICVGAGLNDSKGIIGNVSLTSQGYKNILLMDWKMYVLNLENLDRLDFQSIKFNVTKTSGSPGVFTGGIEISTVGDTFVNFPDGNWTSGYLLANGFNLGKYNPKRGPQKTLYLPTKALMEGSSKMLKVVLFESVPSPLCATKGSTCAIDLIDTPNLG